MLKPAIAAVVVLLLVGVTGLQDAGTRAPAAAQASVPHRHTPPERPRVTVDVPAETRATRVVHVKAGESLQAAIDAASPGDRITLDAGAVYEGPFRLPRKEGDQWIVIASAAESQLPPRGQRVGPSHAAKMPKLVASGDAVVEAMPGAHHYRLVGLEIAPSPGVYVNTIVLLGDREKTADSQPHHLIVERSYLHGDPKKGSRRGVALNSRHTAVIDSHLSDFKEVGVDSQAIAGWNGAGPFRIENNYLEAAGENVMFGGADPTVPDLVPADIQVLRNHLAKPLRWKVGHASYEGTEWAVKNLFELKNARRVLVEGNVLERNWTHAQNGFAILFTVRNQDGRAPWSVVEDVTFINNLVRHVGGGVNVLGRDDNNPSQQTQRIAIRNNLFIDVGGSWGNGRLFQLLDGTSSISIDHNTALQTGSILFGGDHAPHTGFVFQNNIAPHNEHGITGSGTEAGTQTLARYFPSAVVRGNVIVGGNAGQYPADNEFARTLDEAGIASFSTASLRALASQTPRASAGGRVAGADLTTLLKAVGGVAPETEKAADSADRTAGAAGANGGPFINGGISTIAVGGFWLALALLFYVYVGYPLVTALRARLHNRPDRRAAIEPTVSIVVVAYNEAGHIDGRIENLMALDYPEDRLEIVIGSDGSTDGTADRARRYEQYGVTVRAFGTRRGKPAVLNALTPAVKGEIVLFADARQRFERGTLRALIANFADPQVGAVSGELVLQPVAGAATAGHGAAFYWRYEKFIRSAESRAYSTVGATGAIYAIRRELFEPIPEDTLLDDVLVPLRIVRRGYRVLFEPLARAYDCTSATAGQEFARKARTIAGMFQLLSRERWLFSPFHNPLWFETLSHKALRLAIPALHAALLIANIAAAGTWPYQWLLAGQVAFYAAAVGGCLQRQGGRRFVGFTVPYMLCLLSWSTVVGFSRFLTNRQPVTWERAPVAAPATEGASHRASGVAA
jgi:cellulose synthase/poly-beta-1,6-N-acetylglucosamine synthase-like glycosyltransferase